MEHLVERCGFDSVLFEANQDEFLHLNERIREGEDVTSADVLTAVGGLWKFYTDFQPLAPFLLERAKSGHVLLGGIDDQLGQLGQDYANDGMITAFMRLLPASERQDCASALHERIYSEYPQSAPYSKADQVHIRSCLRDVESASRADAVVTEQVRAIGRR